MYESLEIHEESSNPHITVYRVGETTADNLAGVMDPLLLCVV